MALRRRAEDNVQPPSAGARHATSGRIPTSRRPRCVAQFRCRASGVEPASACGPAPLHRPCPPAARAWRRFGRRAETKALGWVGIDKSESIWHTNCQIDTTSHSLQSTLPTWPHADRPGRHGAREIDDIGQLRMMESGIERQAESGQTSGTSPEVRPRSRCGRISGGCCRSHRSYLSWPSGARRESAAGDPDMRLELRLRPIAQGQIGETDDAVSDAKGSRGRHLPASRSATHAVSAPWSSP